MRTVAIDFGKKRLGIAMTDPLGLMALPYKRIFALSTLEETAKAILEALKNYIKEIDLIVIGHPLLKSGEEGDMALLTKKLKEELQKQISVPIELWDERFTSKQADHLLKELDLSRKKREERIDELSAMLILQSYLDSKK